MRTRRDRVNLILLFEPVMLLQFGGVSEMGRCYTKSRELCGLMMPRVGERSIMVSLQTLHLGFEDMRLQKGLGA